MDTRSGGVSRIQGKKLFGNAAGVLVVSTLLGSCSRSDSNGGSVSGTIDTDEVHVASRYGGRVEKILAQEGDTLKPGQVIAELDAAELRARRDQVAALLAELEAGPRKEEIEAAQHDWEALTASLALARADAKRADELFANETISETEHDGAIRRAEALEKNVAAAKSRYDLLRAGTRPERLAQAHAQLAEMDAQLSEMRIAAPSDSVLEVLAVKAGDVLAPAFTANTSSTLSDGAAIRISLSCASISASCAWAWARRSGRVPARSRSYRLLAAATFFSNASARRMAPSCSVSEMVSLANNSSARLASARARASEAVNASQSCWAASISSLRGPASSSASCAAA